MLFGNTNASCRHPSGAPRGAERSARFGRILKITLSHSSAEKRLAGLGVLDSLYGMIRGGFHSPRQRSDLKALLRDGHTEQRLARRANAILELDDGWSCERVAKALYLDDDTIRGWR